jgi:hypothetical protein
MTTTINHPSQLVLPGQAAAPEGPVDMIMMYVMHHAFRRDLTGFAAAAAGTPIEDRVTWRALRDHWNLFSIALHHHHRGEDVALWPLLRDRVSGPGCAVLEAMEAEHDQIDPILTACAEGLGHLADHADEYARAALVVRLTAGREILDQHLAHEETAAIPLMQQVMTDAEWIEMQEGHFKPTDVPARILVKFLPWLTYQMPVDAQQRLLATFPWPMRLVNRLVRPGFVRGYRRAFRYGSGH